MEMACEHFNKAMDLLKLGYGKSYSYMEMVDELYAFEVEAALKKYCRPEKEE